MYMQERTQKQRRWRHEGARSICVFFWWSPAVKRNDSCFNVSCYFAGTGGVSCFFPGKCCRKAFFVVTGAGSLYRGVVWYTSAIFVTVIYFLLLRTDASEMFVLWIVWAGDVLFETTSLSSAKFVSINSMSCLYDGIVFPFQYILGMVCRTNKVYASFRCNKILENNSTGLHI